MVINKKRIHSVDKYLANTAEEKEVYVCVPADEKNLSTLAMQDRNGGISVVPEPKGPITRFNLYGKEVVHKEMEKELREIERDYHIVDWHGTDHYGTCFQSRLCYPKEWIVPPLARIVFDNGQLRSDLMTKEEPELLKHTINMFLEVFGYCEIADKDGETLKQSVKIKEVSWRILPPGKYPWERAVKILNDYFIKAPCKNREVLRNHHKTFAEYEPDFLAIGENCFNGYVVYGYSYRNLYVFESNQPRNATYVFKGEWENASHLTKCDIIRGNLCHKRLVHSKSWKEKVNLLFKEMD